MKKILIISTVIVIILDLFLYFTNNFSSCTSVSSICGEIGAILSPLYYPPFVITYFFGGSLLGLNGEITDLWTNIVFLILAFLYLFIIILLLVSIFKLFKYIFLKIRKIFNDN